MQPTGPAGLFTMDTTVQGEWYASSDKTLQQCQELCDDQSSPWGCSFISQSTSTNSATFVSNQGTVYPNTPLVKIGLVYVAGVIEGGFWKMVAVNAQGTKVELRYMPDSKLLNQANWNQASV